MPYAPRSNEMRRRQAQGTALVAWAALILAAAGVVRILHPAVCAQEGTDGTGQVVPRAERVAEGVVEPAATEQLVSRIYLDRYFVPTLSWILPEWSRVETGAVVAEMRTPWLRDEKAQREQDLRLAEARAREAEAARDVVLAELEAGMSAAQTGLQQAEDRLEALKALPSSADRRRLLLEEAENDARRSHAVAQCRMLTELAESGLCSDAEVAQANRDRAELASQRRYLDAVRDELRGQSTGIEVQKAEVSARKAAWEVEIAGMRKDFESKRQDLLCEAVHLGEVAPARRALELTQKRLAALTVRATGSGFLLYGERWDCWGIRRVGEKVSPGKPVYHGQVIASIVDPSRLRVRASVSERWILELTVGDEARVSFGAIPGRTYAGVVDEILPVVVADSPGPGRAQRGGNEGYGLVMVRVQDADERVRPGMTATVAFVSGRSARPQLSNAGNRPSAAAPPRPAGPSPPRPGALALRGWLEARSRHWVTAPFAGRAVRVAAKGERVEAGQILARIEPGLQENWRSRDESEIARLESLREAAELRLRLTERTGPLLVELARADESLAELSLGELESRPQASERIAAENALDDAKWELDQAKERLEAYRSLESDGMASRADVKRQELQLAAAKARVDAAQAKLDRVLAGASELELAVARSDLEAARVALGEAESLARVDAEVAAAEWEAAGADLTAYREKAQRRLERAERADVKSPVSGIVIGRFVEEGEDVAEGTYLLGVADGTQLEVRAMLDESDYFKVAAGAPARVRLAGVPGRLFAGRVTEIVDWPALPAWYRRSLGESRVRRGKLFRAVVELDEEPPMCVGMSATVEILSPPTGQDAGRVSGSDEEPREGAADAQSD